MYFDTPGKENTEKTLELAVARAEELGIKEIVVATTSGFTARKAHEICKGMKVVAVSYHAGFKVPFELRISLEERKALNEMGIPVICATHALSGIERGLAKKIPGAYLTVLVAQVLKMFGQGLKVAVEVAVMAADSGELSGDKIIAAGGTGKGCDTAVVMTPADMSRFLEMKIHEVLCKPNLYQADAH